MPGLNEIRDNRRTISGFSPNNYARQGFQEDRGLHEDVTFICKLGAALVTEAQLKASFPHVILNINGDDYSKYQTENLLMIDAFEGNTFEAGYLTLPFSNYMLTNKFDQQSTAFMPTSFDDPELQMFIAAGAVDPTFRTVASTEGLGVNGRQAVLERPDEMTNMVIRHYTKTIDILTSGTDKPNDYEYAGGGKRIKAFHFKGANITRIRMLVGEQEQSDFRSLTELNRRLSRRGYVPQADYWHLDFVALADTIHAAFDMNYDGVEQEISFEITTTDGDTANVELLTELYDVPNGLKAAVIPPKSRS